MKLWIDTDDLEIDAKGEVLRNMVFVDEQVPWDGEKYRMKGCYETFDTKPEFVPIDPTKYPILYKEFDWREIVDVKVYAYESPEIVTMWAWDGDGTLLIWIKGEESYSINTDCKCSYGWYESPALKIAP